MPKTTLAVTLDAGLVENLDQLVAERRFANRSQAIETAVAEKLTRVAKTRLARECARMDPTKRRPSPRRDLPEALKHGPHTERRDPLD